MCENPHRKRAERSRADPSMRTRRGAELNVREVGARLRAVAVVAEDCSGEFGSGGDVSTEGWTT